MNVSPVIPPPRQLDVALSSPAVSQPRLPAADDSKLKEAFSDFVGRTFFGEMLSAMRKTVGKPAYFHGGRAEEVFQSQLDGVLSEQLSDASAKTLIEPMFELANLRRQ